MTTRPSQFGTLLKRHRLAAGLTQDALAERAGLSARAVSDLERGRGRTPRLGTVALLGAALGLGDAQRAALHAAARPAPAPPPATLPRPLTSFVGREREIVEVRRLLGTTRLLTLSGTGGVGKSRLALEVAGQLADEVAFVDLAPIADAALVPQAVASALGVPEQPGRPLTQTLAMALRSRCLWLLLDNCEHLVAACAGVAETLLRACPQLLVVATSREPLGLGGEVVWQVAALSLPDLHAGSAAALTVDSEAVRLFVERARAVLPQFVVTDRNARAVAAVCIELDGIPLAIELAAARVRALAPQQIADRLGDGFPLLARGSRMAPARHQTLRAAIDWSYELLTPDERRLFDRLAVFAGGWTLEAAEAVCAGDGIAPGQVLDLIGRLVDRSLVLAEPGPGEAVRYRLLETIRQYAAERLELAGAAEVVSRRHRAWYVAFGEQALRDYWWRVDPLGWLDRLEREQANVRAGLRFSLERGDAELGLRLAVGMWVLWGVRGSWSEGREWLARLMALPGAAEHPAARANALSAAGQMAFQQGEYATSQVLLAEAVDLLRRVGDECSLASALVHAGLAARARGQYAAARTLCREAAGLSRAVGNRGYESVSLLAEAHAAYLQAEYDQARLLAEESLALMGAIVRPEERASVDTTIPRYVLGRVALCKGEYGAARRHLEANLAVWRDSGDVRSVLGALVGLGVVAVAEGDAAQARDLLRQALALSEQLGSRVGLVYTVEGFAILAASEDRTALSVRLAGAAEALRATLEHPISPAEQALLGRWVNPARNVLGEHACAAAWAAGNALSAAQVVEFVHVLSR